MEDIFDRIVEGVKKGASTVIKGASAVADKGEQLVELTRLRAARAKLQDELAQNYEDLGRELYEMVERDHIVVETLRARCAVIGHLKAQIADNIGKETEFQERRKEERRREDGKKDDRRDGPNEAQNDPSTEETAAEEARSEQPKDDPSKDIDPPRQGGDDVEEDEDFGVC